MFFLCLQSCGYHCPGFDDANLCWIPYNKKDSIHYTDGENIIGFEIVDFYKTAPVSHRGDLVMDYDCENEGYYITSQVLNYSIQERYSYGWNYKDPGMKVQITNSDIFLFDIIRFGDVERKESLLADSLKIIFLPDTIIGNHAYNDVFKVFKIKLTDSQKISWIVKAQNKGIIQFYDRKTDKIWTLLEQ